MAQSRLFTFSQTSISTISKDRLLSKCKIVKKQVSGLVLEKELRNAKLEVYDLVPSSSKPLATKHAGWR